MRTCRNMILIIWLWTCLCPLSASAQASESASAPTARHGVLDLTAWDLREDGPIRLDGQWAFYWKELLPPDPSARPEGRPAYIEVPKTWGAQQIEGLPLSDEGYGTYRLTIRLGPHNLDQVLAIEVPGIASAYTLWIDGRLKEAQGVVGRSRAEMTAQHYAKTVYFTPARPEVELVVQASNYVQRKGGIWAGLTLGVGEDMTLAREKRLIVQIVIAGGLLVMGLYHIGLHAFRRSYKPTLWFGVACLMICLRTLFTGDYLWVWLWRSFPWELAVKIEYVSAFLGIGFLILYTQALHPQEMHRKKTIGLSAVIGLMCAPVVCLPARIYTEYMQLNILVLIGAMLYPVFGVVRAFLRKRPGAGVNMAFLLVFFATIVNDSLFYSGVLNTGDLLPWGLYLLLFAQTLILAARFSGAFAQVENLSAQLAETNQTLENKVRERTEELMQANVRLRRVETSRREMLTNISHEFGTPLTSLIGYVTVIQEEDGLPERSRPYMDVIYNKATLLQRLTDDLKSLVQLESHQTSMQFAVVPFAAFYSELENKHRFDVTRKGIHFALHPLPHPLARAGTAVRIDRDRMDQVMTNLISNAIAHTPAGGRIAVSARCFPYARKIVISVADTGTGIRPEETSRVFERFYKGSHSAKRRVQGSGLGLSIAREIVLQHGGRLGVRSREGRGSDFYVILPLIMSENGPADEGGERR